MTKVYVKGPYDKNELTASQEQAVFAKFLDYYHSPFEYRDRQPDLVKKLNDSFNCNKSLRTYRRIYVHKYNEMVTKAQPF